jgi:hypothetical protein
MVLLLIRGYKMNDNEKYSLWQSMDKICAAIEFAERASAVRSQFYVKCLQNLIYTLFGINIGDNLSSLIQDYCGFIPSKVNFDHLWLDSFHSISWN